MRTVSITEDAWTLKKPFIIARGSRDETLTVTVCISEGGHEGLGEAVPAPRYDETVVSVIGQIRAVEARLADGLNRDDLREIMPAGTARNAIDCALWDLEAKQSGQDVGGLTGLGWPENIQTVQTVSILSPDQMGKEAALIKDFPVLKVKLNAELIVERIQAVHANAPNAQLLVDANESWTIEILKYVAPKLANLNVAMIEQPLPAALDDALRSYDSPLPVFADESCHICSDLPKLEEKYRGINIKLDKAGGLTEAIAMFEAAQKFEYDVMMGCMLGTSLGMAPAMFLALKARFVDLDAPALLAKDRAHALEITDGKVSRLDGKLWGGPSQ